MATVWIVMRQTLLMFVYMGAGAVLFKKGLITKEGSRSLANLLLYLVRNRGIALTREKLLNQVWGYDYYGDDRTLDTHIKLLRKQLGPYAGHIVTLRGVGYRFEE